MARIRVTRELLEYALDLPANVQLIAEAGAEEEVVDGVECFVFNVSIAGDSFNGHSEAAGDGLYALGYEETADGLRLVSAVPAGQPGD